MRQAVWSPLFVEGGWGPGRGSYLPMATHSGASRGRGAVGMFPLLQADSQANYPCNSDRKASVLVHILSLPPLLYRTNYLLWTTYWLFSVLLTSSHITYVHDSLCSSHIGLPSVPWIYKRWCPPHGLCTSFCLHISRSFCFPSLHHSGLAQMSLLQRVFPQPP